MSAKVLLMIRDAGLLAELSEPLADRFNLVEGRAPDKLAGPDPAARDILAVGPDLVIMDYEGEDALSVKILQEVNDNNPKVGFIFVDSAGLTDRENVLMAINEGASAFVTPGIQPVALQNYVNRALNGPRRHHPAENPIDEDELQKVGQQLTNVKTRLNNAEKLIAYLLSTPLSAQPRKALILSDSAYQRELLRKHLEDHNFVVLTASTVVEAVNATMAERPRIVISDYELEEGQTGVDFCRELKFVQKFTPCFFVVCTASQDRFSQIMTPGNGVDDCVLKPATPKALNAFLTRMAMGLII
jgi:DNA-binding response OmpR family regulator